MVYERSPNLGSLLEVFDQKQVMIQTHEGKVRGVLRFDLNTSVRLVVDTPSGRVIIANWSRITTPLQGVKD